MGELREGAGEKPSWRQGVEAAGGAVKAAACKGVREELITVGMTAQNLHFQTEVEEIRTDGECSSLVWRTVVQLGGRVEELSKRSIPTAWCCLSNAHD